MKKHRAKLGPLKTELKKRKKLSRVGKKKWKNLPVMGWPLSRRRQFVKRPTHALYFLPPTATPTVNGNK